MTLRTPLVAVTSKAGMDALTSAKAEQGNRNPKTKKVN